ncbi:cytochrome c oxidase subunit III [Acidocella aquatica]|uniref:Cytochrome c oxidase subunit III n=2 Tax=Acidocella aquatica TaxID=1922313 RepID=A0ABQ6A2H9_9PROT|nr:cytochrome c oxidase subunit III [Acidocella aquatica]
MVFSLFFLTFTYYRGQEVALFAQSQKALSQYCGIINTVLLLTSSWFVANALNAARAGAGRRAQRLFSLAGLCGLGFVVVKVIEYSGKIDAGITLTTNDFFMFYFMFTGIHLVHVLIGLAVLSYAYHRAGREVLRPGDLSALECCAIFWHLVDFLWIVLFAIFYLMK